MATEVIPKLKYAQFRQLPDDGKRYELINGYVHFLPTPTPRHQTVLGNLSGSLGICLQRDGPGILLFAPLDVLLADDTALQPDLIFISNARARIITGELDRGGP